MLRAVLLSVVLVACGPTGAGSRWDAGAEAPDAPVRHLTPDADVRPPDARPAAPPDAAAASVPRPAGTAFVYVGGGNDTIHVLTLDLATGALGRRGTATAPRPAHASLSPDGKLLFAASSSRSRPARARRRRSSA